MFGTTDFNNFALIIVWRPVLDLWLPRIGVAAGPFPDRLKFLYFWRWGLFPGWKRALELVDAQLIDELAYFLYSHRATSTASREIFRKFHSWLRNRLLIKTRYLLGKYAESAFVTTCRHFRTRFEPARYARRPQHCEEMPTSISLCTVGWDQERDPNIQAVLWKGYRGICRGKTRHYRASQQPTSRLQGPSYAWGDPTRNHVIHIDGEALGVATNLYNALLRLSRQPSQQSSQTDEDSLYLWIDAICIDQDNIRERNHQVPWMNTVYSAASEVLVWLGCGSQRSAHSLSTVLGESSRPPPSGEYATEAVETLVHSAWTRRLWTVQEVALACGPVTVMYGNFSFPWTKLMVELNRTKVLENPGTLSLAKCFVQRRNLQRIPSSFETVLPSPSKQPFPLTSLFRETIGFQFNNPSDRVYALLGMAVHPVIFDQYSRCVVMKVYWVSEAWNLALSIRYPPKRENPQLNGCVRNSHSP